MTDRSMVEALLRPEAYPWRPPQIDLIETHVSWVFLAGNRVIKVKRPVDYGFVNHTTLESRRLSCVDEVRLNRRLTSDVYLDAVPITRDQSGYHVAGAGTPVEWATLMRRLPAEGMLDVILAKQSAPADLAARLAARLIPFHQHLAPPCDGSADALMEMTTAVVIENLDQLQPFSGAPLGTGQLGLVTTAMRRFVTEHAALLRARAAAGWIRDGHGDLRSEHVCLEPDGTLQIFDCVEFNQELRCADVASDLAFLMMDLDRLGAPAAGAALLASYRDAGVDLPSSLLRFYRAHRALVRAKVACLKHDASLPEARPALATKAVSYLNVATADALTVCPALIVMTGLSGTGKSVVASDLARALGAECFASDRIRKELAGQAGPAPAAWGEGIYTTAWTDATYTRLWELASATVAQGRAAILDATFLDPGRREEAAATARRAAVPFVLVETVCDEAVVERRLAARQAHADAPSDASYEIYRRQRAEFDRSPIPVPPGAVLARIDTSRDGAVTLDPVLAVLEREGAIRAQISESREPLHERTSRNPAR